MPKHLIITSFNGGRFLLEQTRAYLKRLAVGEESRPDVMCLQDIPFRDLPLFEWAPYVTFAPMTNHLINGQRAVVGIAVASCYFMTDITHHITWGNGNLKDLQGVDCNNQRAVPTAEGDRVIDSTEDRVVICATIVKDGVEYNIATTHGFWARGGGVNDAKRSSTIRLRDALVHEAVCRGGLVFAGDLNCARSGEIYNMLTNTLHDCMPIEIDNTLDPDHPFVRKGGKVVNDYVMTCDIGHGSKTYDVSDVTLRSGVSDHCALSAMISRS